MTDWLTVAVVISNSCDVRSSCAVFRI